MAGTMVDTRAPRTGPFAVVQPRARPGSAPSPEAAQVPQAAHVMPGAAAHPDPWVGRFIAITDYVIAKVPAAGGGGRGMGVAVAVLYLFVVVHAAGFVAHLVGDGTVKARAARTDCHVVWLVMRAVADDRGEPPPPFDPLACEAR